MTTNAAVTLFVTVGASIGYAIAWDRGAAIGFAVAGVMCIGMWLKAISR